MNFTSGARLTQWRISALLFLCSFHVSSLLGQTLQITSPTDGSTVSPGQSLTVNVSASGAFQQVLVVGWSPIGFSDPLAAPPYQFTVQIPTNIQPGHYQLTADGVTTTGIETSSDPINIDIERPDAPISLSVQPSRLKLSLGDAGYLRVIGTFSDGTTADLTLSTLTSYRSTPSVATVTSQGIVSPVAQGGGGVTVTYGNLSVGASVTVFPPFNIAPRQKDLYAAQTEQFVIQSTALTPPTVTWSLSPDGVGTIDQNGLYTAPSSIPAQQTVTVTATSTTDSTQSAGANVILFPALTVNVTPTTASLTPSQSQLFAGLVTNAIDTDVVWSSSPAGVGGIDDDGRYTAPASVTSVQTVIVMATSVMDDTKAATATVTLAPTAVATPSFTPIIGTYNSAQTVTISTTTPGASINYTVDGSTPSETAGTLYRGPITVGVTTTINAIAFESGMADSAVASATYTINPVAPWLDRDVGTVGTPGSASLSVHLRSAACKM